VRSSWIFRLPSARNTGERACIGSFSTRTASPWPARWWTGVHHPLLAQCRRRGALRRLPPSACYRLHRPAKLDYVERLLHSIAGAPSYSPRTTPRAPGGRRFLLRRSRTDPGDERARSLTVSPKAVQRTHLQGSQRRAWTCPRPRGHLICRAAARCASMSTPWAAFSAQARRQRAILYELIEEAPARPSPASEAEHHCLPLTSYMRARRG